MINSQSLYYALYYKEYSYCLLAFLDYWLLLKLSVVMFHRMSDVLLKLLEEYKLPLCITAGVLAGSTAVLFYGKVKGGRGAENSKWAVDPIKE